MSSLCTMDYSRSLVFIGNPGSGKSTLVNCMLQELVFHAGLSASGIGVTQNLQVQVHQGVRYIDTLGLSDFALRKKAAAAIDTVLKEGGAFQVCFVLTLQSNRIVPDDLTTMKLVLDAANQITENNYSIIINQVSEKALARLDKEAFVANLKQGLEGRAPTTNHIHFIQQYEELKDEDNQLVSLDAKTMSFFTDMPVFNVDSASVLEVNYLEFDQMQEKLDQVSQDLGVAQKMADDALKAKKEEEAKRKFAEEAEKAAKEAERKAAKEAEEAEEGRLEAERKRKEEAEEADRKFAASKTQAIADQELAVSIAKEESEKKHKADKHAAVEEAKKTAKEESEKSREEENRRVNAAVAAALAQQRKEDSRDDGLFGFVRKAATVAGSVASIPAAVVAGSATALAGGDFGEGFSATQDIGGRVAGLGAGVATFNVERGWNALDEIKVES